MQDLRTCLFPARSNTEKNKNISSVQHVQIIAFYY